MKTQLIDNVLVASHSHGCHTFPKGSGQAVPNGDTHYGMYAHVYTKIYADTQYGTWTHIYKCMFFRVAIILPKGLPSTVSPCW